MSQTSEELLDQLDELAQDLKALANERRLHLLHLLTTPRYGEELSEALGTSRPNALKHVEKLDDRGFVRSMPGRRESGPVKEYQVVPQRLYALSVTLQDLGRLEPEGGPEIAGSPATMDDRIGEAGEGEPPKGGDRHPRLRILDGPETGNALELDEEGRRWRIGREEALDLTLDHDPYVSGRHAEVHPAPAGYAIVDVHSSNGTYLNFEQLPAGGRAELAPGDIVRIGHTRLVYQDR